MKTCSKCKVTKDDNEFYRDKRYSDGLASRCRECQKKTTIVVNAEKKLLQNRENLKTQPKPKSVKKPKEKPNFKFTKEVMSNKCLKCRAVVVSDFIFPDGTKSIYCELYKRFLGFTNSKKLQNEWCKEEVQ